MNKTIDYKKIMELVDSYRDKGFSISTSVKKVQLSTPELEKVNYLTLRKNVYKLIKLREKDFNNYIQNIVTLTKKLNMTIKEERGRVLVTLKDYLENNEKEEEVKVVSKLTFWQKLKNIFGFS